MATMKIALCQINSTVGDFEGNARTILRFARQAKRRGAALAVFPELALTGYTPRDLVARRDFQRDAARALKELARRLPLAALVGTIEPNPDQTGNPVFNSAAFIQGGRVRAMARKILLPTYDVFDEARHFEPGRDVTVIRIGGRRVGVTICEDIWNDPAFTPPRLDRKRYPVNPVEMLARTGCDLIVNLSASPYDSGKPAMRREMIGDIAAARKICVAQVNMVGGNDELLFDGNSFAADAHGQPVAAGRPFHDDIALFDAAHPAPVAVETMPEVEETYRALVMGVRDYARKTGFTSAVLGLSGGIDSALTAVIAADALGPANVRGVLMPGPYSSKGSITDARALAENLGMHVDLIRIDPVFRAMLRTLKAVFRGTKPGVAEENLQARIRGSVLMALSNKFGHLLLSTGNKSELAAGYCTLYGDMCGGLAVISDVPKTLVYELALFVNREREIIPLASITKPPSAELRPNQKDQDTLPPYPVLDEFLQDYVEDQLDWRESGGPGLTGKRRRQLKRMVDMAEYKRRQAAPGLKVTQKAFGMGRRMPVARLITE